MASLKLASVLASGGGWKRTKANGLSQRWVSPTHLALDAAHHNLEVVHRPMRFCSFSFVQGIGLVPWVNNPWDFNRLNRSRRSFFQPTRSGQSHQKRRVLRQGATWTKTQCLCLQMALNRGSMSFHVVPCGICVFFLALHGEKEDLPEAGHFPNVFPTLTWSYVFNHYQAVATRLGNLTQVATEILFRHFPRHDSHMTQCS